MHPTIEAVTRDIERRSSDLRDDYLGMIDQMGANPVDRKQLSCGNLAHGFAACSSDDKATIKMMEAANVGIVTAYNDMLSAHQPYAPYPDLIKAAVKQVGSTAQVAGGVPAMCDGVTQGQDGMELSLFSRDVIAQATAVSLSHQMFDAVVMLGICDKIVPGLLIGALQFGHLPVMMIPAGPMPSGLPNKEKARIRQLFAEGKIGRDELLEAESASYHSPGTCTFYGTANTNQMMVEAMGLQLPGSSFVNPGTELRDKLTEFAAQQVTRITALGRDYRPMAHIVDARALVNALVALLASGGSTNHCIHLIAIARAAGYRMNWSDFDAVSRVTPLLARIYPNGNADVNHFHAAGGTPLLFTTLLNAGLMHPDAKTCLGEHFADFVAEPGLDSAQIEWNKGITKSLDANIISDIDNPFAPEGGVRLLEGNLGRSVIKISAVNPEHWRVRAPAVVIDDQNDLKALFEAGELDRDCVVVVRFQGPAANGMPELHKLTPMLGVLQDRGFQVALVTDGRMSGASGKVPAAIHLTPEAVSDGPIGKVHNGDIITLDAHTGDLTLEVDDANLSARVAAGQPEQSRTVGRHLFGNSRAQVSDAESGASFLF
ncbi:phosphogluconate dehydratase [Luminiphilus syltensis NOR5-1B]|uniref:Phosphogluconate dehydratase n=1 Tax=Luminiphilus syltensis NOR5-1B TaxID=565045 RepID=B8KWX9_9GAMM|nr:phosphogluconate dehydratase [Luminiphilus syltensis]EED35525.1 phosphogluconate dehydratase [Luminiphilus syltensis NOR5-1B]